MINTSIYNKTILFQFEWFDCGLMMCFSETLDITVKLFTQSPSMTAVPVGDKLAFSLEALVSTQTFDLLYRE